MSMANFGYPHDDAGRLLFGDIPATELAASYGTPLIIIDTERLDRRIALFEQAAASLDPKLEIAYAGKAFLPVALVKRLSTTRLGLDCCSLGEVVVAEAADFPAERITLHGCGKTTAELTAATTGRVGRVVVDGLDELRRLAALAHNQQRVDILLRFNTGIEAHTHAFVRTGGDETKFGFAAREAAEAYAIIAAEPALRCIGLHSHIGSQILESEPFLANLDALLDIALDARAHGMNELTHLILGGGFGVAMSPKEAEKSIDLLDIIARIGTYAQERAKALDLPKLQLGIEPGRAIIAEAGTTLYRIVAMKEHGQQRYAIVDGGMNDNPRPALYQSYHHPELASRSSTAALRRITVCGRTCENDRLVEADLPDDLAVGDLLAFHVTGAYTQSMSSNYNRFSRPAVVFVGDGQHRLVVRREAPEELLRYESL